MRLSGFSQALRAAQGDIFRLSRMMNFSPTDQQASLFKAVQAGHRYVGVKSGQGPGKTAASCVVAVYRALQDIDAMVVVTAPTMRQVKEIWMSELRRRLLQADPDFQKLFDATTSNVTICGRRDWGIRTVTSTAPENVQGYHQRFLTFILEEASGIERPIWQTIKGTLTNEEALLLAVGNPNTRECEFFDAFNKDAELWHCLTWNAEDSPYVAKEQIRRMELEYGRDSDVFRVRVLGEFPLSDPNTVINSEDVIACFKTDLGKAMLANHERQIGIDLARFGSDESVVIARRGLAALRMQTFNKREPADVIAWAFSLEKELNWEPSEVRYVVDAGGMGQGVMHLFRDSRRTVYEFHTQARPYETQEYKDQMTEAWFNLRKLVKERKLHLPNDSRLLQQLGSRQYRFDKGKFRLESKDEYKKRLGTEEFTSPDRADALVMAFYPHLQAYGQVFSIEDARSEVRIASF